MVYAGTPWRPCVPLALVAIVLPVMVCYNSFFVYAEECRKSSYGIHGRNYARWVENAMYEGGRESTTSAARWRGDSKLRADLTVKTAGQSRGPSLCRRKPGGGAL